MNCWICGKPVERGPEAQSRWTPARGSELAHNRCVAAEVKREVREREAALRRVAKTEEALSVAKHARYLAWRAARQKGASDTEIADAAGLSRAAITKQIGKGGRWQR